MRCFLSFFTMIALMNPFSPALACRQLVEYPDHLEVEDAKSHYIVEIWRAEHDCFSGTVIRSFGGSFSLGQNVDVRFARNEEARAVCPITLVPGKVYLLRSKSISGVMEIPRYNWLNIPADHGHFDDYVHDLELVSAGRE